MYTRILVPLADTAPGRRGLHEGLGIARAQASTVVLLHVAADARADGDGEALLARGAREAAATGVFAERVLRVADGAPLAEVIAEEARRRRCELIVMGRDGPGRAAGHLLRRTALPVLLVQPDEG